MKKYEITFIVGENATEDKAKEIAENIRKLFEEHGAKIEKEFYWGKRKLVYKIAKNSFGYYFVLIFDLDPAQLNLINHELGLNEKIIRYLIVDFIESSPFFELEGEKTNKQESHAARDQAKPDRKPFKHDRKEIEEKPASPAGRLEGNLEEIEGKKEIVEEKPKLAVEEKVEKPAEEAEEKVKEIAEVEPEIKPEPEAIIEEKPIKKVKEKPKEEVKEVASPATEEAAPVKEEEIERKPERRKMTEEERKEALEKKLAELLKDEEI